MGLLVTPTVAREVADIIRQYHAAMAAAVCGQSAVSSEDWNLAVTLGLVDPTDPNPAILADLHVFGAMLAHLNQAGVESRYGTTEAEFKAEIARNPVPMTTVEHHAAEFSMQSAAEAIRGLGNKMGATLGSSLIEADAALDKRLRETMRDVVAARFGDEDAAERMKDRAVDLGKPEDFFQHSFRDTVRGVTSDLGHATEDWARDLQRIAHTEGHKAVAEGLVNHWLEQEEPPDDDAPEDVPDLPVPAPEILVFKIPRPGACKHCLELHEQNGCPRIYRLSDATGNGTNIGRKAADWRFVVGPVHPWCGCPLVRVPSLVSMPAGWRSGEAAPTVIGPGGRLVIP